ncbi:histidine kinase [Streptomyces albus]|uniref:sensor histidine kinase n=1 Tax=Streptomyces albus TaxID=1888 RepID=UPI0033DD1DED
MSRPLHAVRRALSAVPAEGSSVSRQWVALGVPVALGLADAFLVNGVRPGPELWVSLAAALALLVRWRAPVPVFVVSLVGIYVGYIWFAPMIALYTVTARRRSNVLAVAGAVALAVAHYLPYPLDGFTPTADREDLLDMVDSCVQAVVPAVSGRWARTRRELRERVRELTVSRHREAELLAERAVITERARLAREMHDVVAHQVSLISVQAGALQMTCQDGTSRELARTVRELAVKTLTELRHMVGALRSGSGAPPGLAPQPRLCDLPALTEGSGLPVTLDLPALPEDAEGGAAWPEAVERAAYRTVQEALTNVGKHAPGARVHVTVRAAEQLTVTVRNGPPPERDTVSGALPSGDEPPLPGGGHGLLGLRERALLLGGTFLAGPTGDGGFLVAAQFPAGTRTGVAGV